MILMFFTVRLQMHARRENMSRRENYFVILVLFDCVGVYVVNLAHESETVDYLASLSDVKYFQILLKIQLEYILH